MIFTQVGPCGIRLICQFLELSKLDRFVAASYGAQQQVSQKMRAGLAVFGAQERSRMAEGMAPKELHKATSLSLQAQVSQASQEVEQAEKQKLEAEEEYQNYRSHPPRGGFPPDFPKRIARARQAEQEARSRLDAASARRDQMREAIRGLSEAYHPYDLKSGCSVEAREVEQRLEAQFAEIDRVAGEAQPSESSRRRIEKARRLIGSFVATMAFFHLCVQMWVGEQGADLFQRSSSCVEGRNGQLALRHHSLHRLSNGKLVALTVVHNYYLTRRDGTTAAERFFGAKPRDLFGWLVDHLDVPARPAAKRSNNRRKAA